MKNGVYFLHPEGCAWVAAFYKDDSCVDVIHECDFGTHKAANDCYANIEPKHTDVEVDDEDECKEVIREVLGDVNPEMVCVSRPAPTYTLCMNDVCGCDKEVSFDEWPSNKTIQETIEEWVYEGSWGEIGASIQVNWTLKEDDEEVDSGDMTVEIEPDHEELIREACGPSWDERQERSCGNSPDDHDWTSEGEGGCTQNPGVWSTGGTSMLFSSHCRQCGLHCNKSITGSQKNPGEHDTVEYEMSETWCSLCEKEECEYKHKFPETYFRFSECEPEGEEIASFPYFDQAMNYAREYVHEKGPKVLAIGYDDIEDGDGEYHVIS